MPETIGQDNFSGGVFRGRRAPKYTCFDIVNGLISDEGELFRRGGSTYKSGSNSVATLIGLWDGHTPAGRRTLFWSASALYVLGSNDSSVVTIFGVAGLSVARVVELGGVVFLANAASGDGEIYYAGSRKSTFYSTGTVSLTSGSATVTGSGTSWLANVDAGMVLTTAARGFAGVVKSVESNTSLTLVKPARASEAAVIYELDNAATDNSPVTGQNPTQIFRAVAGQRLLRAFDNRVYFSRPVTSSEFYGSGAAVEVATIEDVASDYHELPQAAVVTGADAIQDTAVIFTTAGVWTIGNMALDAVDPYGNVQHRVEQISQDVILWGDPGIAAYKNALIVPAIDDVYVLALGVEPVPLSAGIRPLYREYVEAGYKPGLATVFRGHYMLPILDSSDGVIDTLVCRLDRGPAWTRWANGASGRGYARRVGSTTRQPELLGLAGLRVTSLTGCFDPDSTRKDDADGTDHALTVTTNDYPLGRGLQKGHVLKVRATYSLVDAGSDNPSTTMQWARGPEGSSFMTVDAVRGGGESDGQSFSSWLINKSAEAMRFKWSTVGAAASATLRKIELIVRPFGKQ